MLGDIKYGLFKYEVKDYYAILGLPLDTNNAKQIRSRYHKIAYQLHPDTSHGIQENHKDKANQILSRLVNPAYENLYKDKSRRECQLIISETGRKLASDAYKITISTEIAKKLFKEENNRDKLYRELVEQFSLDLYKDLDKTLTKIAMISELNMVYIMLQKDTELQKIRGNQVKSIPTNNPVQQSNPNINVSENNQGLENQDNLSPKQDKQGETKSKLSKIIDNARQHQEDGNFEQAILELREALKIEPDNSIVHALIGSFYLEQNNKAYAKIHLKKALTLNPDESTAKECQAKIKELEGSKSNTKSTDKKSSDKSATDNKGKKAPQGKDKKDGKDSKDKKNVPKIFGIPLW